MLRVALWLLGIGLLGLLSLVIVVVIALAVAYPKLPDVSDLQNYQPKLPLKIISVEGQTLGEFGEEKRTLTPIAQIPKVMQDAVLAIEDSRFFEHGGLDYIGIIRAGLANVGRVSKSQGASTITMQVARNVYLTNEKTFTRKIYEILLTFKLESSLSKQQILEIYMNQIYLGQRAYGFAAASETYFGKPLKDISIAEAAMLAGLPKAPSSFNPIVNPKRARVRQLHIIDRMVENGFITAGQATQAKAEPLKLRSSSDDTYIHAEYLAEIVRQMVFNQYGDETYTRGINAYTTVKAAEQLAAYKALRQGILDYERRQVYRGPEKFVQLPTDLSEIDDAVSDALDEKPDNGELLAAVVLEASPKKVTVMRRNGETLDITGSGLQPVQSGLAEKAPQNIKLRRGAIVRVAKNAKAGWELTQLPEVEGAFVSLDPRTGGITAMVGGFDFNKNKFNHVTQAWRQPGSSFKPFIYSAALEKGFNGATIVNDAPLFFSGGVTGSQAWEPKNYDGKFEGPMPLRTALAKSKNMVSIRILQSVGAQNAQDWITRFGFDAEKHPPYLTMALGAGSVTPLQMVTGYSVFANGGHRLNPYIVTKLTDQKGRVLAEPKPVAISEETRAVDQRNAFVMSSLLQEITRSGTAAKAQATLKRPDLYGKTGTTNDSMDAWFVGFQPTIAAAVWIGYDTPRKMGDRETGGGLALPVWIGFMETALKNVPVMEPPVPEGVVNVGGEWMYDDMGKGKSVSSLGMDEKPGSTQAFPASEEKKKILDLFRN
jgi:penicillin-binding protein 1A